MTAFRVACLWLVGLSGLFRVAPALADHEIMVEQLHGSTSLSTVPYNAGGPVQIMLGTSTDNVRITAANNTVDFGVISFTDGSAGTVHVSFGTVYASTRTQPTQTVGRNLRGLSVTSGPAKISLYGKIGGNFAPTNTDDKIIVDNVVWFEMEGAFGSEEHGGLLSIQHGITNVSTVRFHNMAGGKIDVVEGDLADVKATGSTGSGSINGWIRQVAPTNR